MSGEPNSGTWQELHHVFEAEHSFETQSLAWPHQTLNTGNFVCVREFCYDIAQALLDLHRTLEKSCHPFA